MGKLIRNGIEYGGGNGTDIFEVTQAEYDALVQAGTLVHNALYVITDAPNLNETAKDISYDGSTDTVWDKVEGKANKTWTYIDKINLNGTCSVSGYSEILIILYVNNNRNRESFVYPISELSEDTEMHSIIVNSSANVTNYANATVKVASNTLTYTGRSLVGWNNLYLKIYAR